MAEAIGVASRLLALASFALQSSVTLYETVRSFQNHPKRVRDLTEELEALRGVLESLTETVNIVTDVDLTPLELPLLRCGKACREFQQELLKCSSRTEATRTSFRDWTKLRYMGENIDGFRQLLAGYKSTINIALMDANLRRSSVTAEGLETYKELIRTVTNDLEAHLRSIDERLETIFGRTVPESASDVTEMQTIKEERKSAQKCLQICAQLSDHIDQIQISPGRDGVSPAHPDPYAVPERLTATGLRACKNDLLLTTAKLERYMKERIDRLVTQSNRTKASTEDLADLSRLQEEWETARQCRDICSKAGNHLRENISTIDNYATGDAIQFMVSTEGKTIHGTNRGLGWRTRQVGGHLSDVTVQQLSRDMSNASLQSSRAAMPPSPDQACSNTGEEVGNFSERFGHGYKLTPQASSDDRIIFKLSTKDGPSGSSRDQN